MKTFFTSTLLLALLFGSQKAKALASGIYTVPNPRISTLAALIDDLNTNGIVGVGGVTINLDADFVAPSGGYVLGSVTLNGSMSPLKFITINGAGHILTANAGTGNADAIFTVQGTDYVTLNNIKFRESPTNTTATTMMERGVAVVKRTPDDGVATFSLTNCEIVLNQGNTTAATGISPAGATGVFIGNCTNASTVPLSAPSIPDGAHNDLYLFKNVIQNVNHGVVGYGNLLNADGTANNDKNITISENAITNFTHEGVWMAFFSNALVSSNMINNMADGGVAPINNNLYGVAYFGNTSITTNESWDCSKNNIDLTINSAGTYEVYGIFTGVNGTGTTNIGTDTIKLTSAGTSAGMIGIYSQNDKGTQNISGNYIHNFTNSTAGSQRIAAIYNGYSATWALTYPATYYYPSVSIIDKNLITDLEVYTSAMDNLGIFHVCSDVNLTIGATSFTNNVIQNITQKNSSSRFFAYGSTYILQGLMDQSANISGNIFTNISTDGTTTPTYVMWPRSGFNGRVSTINKNTISKITAGTGRLIALGLDYSTSSTMSRDTITDLKGSAEVYGIYAGSSGYAHVTIQLDNSLITTLSSSAATTSVMAVRIDPGTVPGYLTTAIGINNNSIKLISASGTGAAASGLALTSGSFNATIYNNMISDIAASANVTDYSSSFGLNVQSLGTNKIWYNTVNLNTAATGASGYGATGLLYNPGGTNTIQNNILRVNVTAGTGNNVAAMRAGSGVAASAPSLAAFTAASNIYYTPSGPNNFLYAEGTATTGLVNGYNVSGLTANSTRNIVNDPFFNSDCDSSLYYKFMKGSGSRELNTRTEDNLTGAAGVFAPSGISYAEGTAKDILSVSTDFLMNPRAATGADIGALEFTGSVRPKMNITISSSTGFDIACPFNLPELKATIPAFFNHVSYQWYKDTSRLIDDTTLKIAVQPVSAVYAFAVYDSVTGCTHVSDSFRITIVPPPPAIITYYDSLIFCESSAIVIQANKGTDYSYRWMRNGSFLAGETNDHLVVDKSGDYSLEVNTPLGCATTSTLIHIKVYPLPVPTISYDGGNNLTTQLYYLYQWYLNNVKIPGKDAQARVYHMLSDGAYTVEVTDSNGCTAKSDNYLYSLGIENNTLQAAIRIFPNPVSDKLFIESPIVLNAQISDLTGRIIQYQKNVKSIATGELVAGMYLLSLTDQENKLIKVEKINKIK